MSNRPKRTTSNSSHQGGTNAEKMITTHAITADTPRTSSLSRLTAPPTTTTSTSSTNSATQALLTSATARARTNATTTAVSSSSSSTNANPLKRTASAAGLTIAASGGKTAANNKSHTHSTNLLDATPSSSPNGNPMEEDDAPTPASSTTCAICLDVELQDPATLDCCRHSFCFDCIQQWSTQIASTCPLCKSNIHAITHFGETKSNDTMDEDDEIQIISKPGSSSKSAPQPITVLIPAKLQRHTWEATELEELPDEIRNARCSVCHRDDREDQLLLCDGCDQACHTDCVGLSEVPEGDFFCQHCEIERQDEEENGTSSSDSDDDDDDEDRPRKCRRLHRLRDLARGSSSKSRRAAAAASVARTAAVWNAPNAPTRHSRRQLSRAAPSSLGTLPFPSSGISDAGADFASRMAAQLAGWTGGSSRKENSAAQARARKMTPSTKAAAAATSSAQPVASSAWTARQALRDMESQRQRFIAEKREEKRKRQDAAEVEAARNARPVMSPAQTAELARKNQERMMARIEATRKVQPSATVAAPPRLIRPATVPTSSFSSSTAASAQPIRRRIPKKSDASPIEIQMSPGKSPFTSPTTPRIGSYPYHSNGYPGASAKPSVSTMTATAASSTNSVMNRINNSSMSSGAISTHPFSSSTHPSPNSSRLQPVPSSSLERVASPQPSIPTPVVNGSAAALTGPSVWSKFGPTPGPVSRTASATRNSTATPSSLAQSNPPSSMVDVTAPARSNSSSALLPSLPPILSFDDYDRIQMMSGEDDDDGKDGNSIDGGDRWRPDVEEKESHRSSRHSSYSSKHRHPRSYSSSSSSRHRSSHDREKHHKSKKHHHHHSSSSSDRHRHTHSSSSHSSSHSSRHHQSREEKEKRHEKATH